MHRSNVMQVLYYTTHAQYNISMTYATFTLDLARTLPQVASHIAGLWTRLKLGQEGKTKVFVTFKETNKE